MNGITVPERTEDFTADPVELYFDLAFVLAFSQLVGHLVHHPDAAGAAEAALILTLLWLPWSQLTWAANAVSGNGRVVRLMFLIGTVAAVPMAAATSTALDEGGAVFAISLSVIFLLGTAMALWGQRDHPDILRSLLRWNGTTIVALVVLVTGGFLDGDVRLAAWLLSAAIVVVAMIRAGSGTWLIRPGHFAERHGLIIIIALGEVIVAIGVPVVESLQEGAALPMATVSALTAAGAFAGLFWWAYFDRFSPGLEHAAAAAEDTASGRFVRDVYTWLHLPIVAGVILAAAALEEIALHPLDTVPGNFRAMLLGGIALMLLSVVGAIWRAHQTLARERLVSLLPLGLLILTAGSWNGVWLVVAVDLVLLVTLVVEHQRVEALRA